MILKYKDSYKDLKDIRFRVKNAREFEKLLSSSIFDAIVITGSKKYKYSFQPNEIIQIGCGEWEEVKKLKVKDFL